MGEVSYQITYIFENCQLKTNLNFFYSKRVILGVLKEVNKEQNRVVFEFHDDNKIYNAWSSNKWAKENMKKFKVQF